MWSAMVIPFLSKLKWWTGLEVDGQKCVRRSVAGRQRIRMPQIKKKTEADAMAVVPLRMSRRSERQRME